MNCNYFNLIDGIRDALTAECTGRCLDDAQDFEAVVETIESVVEEWLEPRCEGCR